MSGRIDIDTKVCVIGSGPAGMVLALELAEAGYFVTLIESGSYIRTQGAQALSEAKRDPESSHAPMADAVSRQWGGTGNLWGGRCVPYDPVDFLARPELGVLGWPFESECLDAYWAQACHYLDCGPPRFLSADAIPNAGQLAEGFFNGSSVRSDQLERWSAESVISRRLGQRVSGHPRIHTLLGWTAVGFSSHQNASVDSVLINKTGNNRETVNIKTDFVILACGGVESTRLLLNAHDNKQILVEGIAHLGHYYMGHLSGKIASIQLSGAPEGTDYAFQKSDGYYVRRRVTFTKHELVQQSLLNISLWLDNPPPSDPKHRSGVLSSAYLGMRIPLIGKRLAPDAIRKALLGKSISALVMWRHLANVFMQLPSAVSFSIGFLWNRFIKTPRIPGFFVFSPANCYALHYHSEQSSNWDSTISLIDDRDSSGLRRVKISLRFLRRDAESVVKAHELFDAHLRINRIGYLEYWYPEGERVEAVLGQACDGFHQIGTARMATSSKDGVTDKFGRVFGISNLYVCSSAIFPTSSQANPTLTLIAFALRQVEHLNYLTQGK